MAAVDISIGHNDYLMVAELFDIELIPDAGAERDYHWIELVVAVDFIGARLLDIQHLAPHGEDSLESAVSALDRGARSGVALDDVYLAEGRVALVAVLKLVRHLAGLKSGLAADGFLGLAGCLAGTVCHHGLFKYRLCGRWVLLKIGRELVVDYAVDQSPDIRVAELLLGLTLELRLRKLDGDDRGDALADVLAGDLIVALYGICLHAVGVYDTGERGFEAGLMHTALRSMDVVCKGDEILGIAVVILQGDLGYRVALGAAEVYDLLVQRIFMAVEVIYKLADAALIAHRVALAVLGALIGYLDMHAAVQECLLAQSGVQRLIVIYGCIKKFGVGLEGDDGAVLIGIADYLHLLRYPAAGKLHLIDFALFVNLNLEPLGQGVDDGSANAVQAAGYLIASAAELAAGVQHGIDDLERGSAGLCLYIYWYTAAVIGNGNGVAWVDGDGYMVAEAGKRLVDCVVNYLINQMMQSGRRGRADIHAGAFAHGFKSFENLNLRSVIFVHFFFYIVCHLVPPSNIIMRLPRPPLRGAAGSPQPSG